MKTMFEDTNSVKFDNKYGRVIKIFDFDGTVFNSPIPNCNLWDRRMFGKLMSEPHNGGYGWFQNIRTLEDRYINRSDFNKDVVNEVRKSMSEENSVTVMLTGRSYKYEHIVKRILDRNELVFDHYAFKPTVNNVNIVTLDFKQQFIRDLVTVYGDVSRIEIWEDRIKHADKFNELLNSLNLNGGIHVVTERNRYMEEYLERELVDLLCSDVITSGVTTKSSSTKKPIYYGAFLYPDSHNDLIELTKHHIPDGWKLRADHMTILFGCDTDEVIDSYLTNNIGADVYINVTSIGISSDSIAVKVDTDIPIYNEIPHITVAVPICGSPVNSNFITNWTSLNTTLKVKANIKAFYG